MAMETVNSHFR
ncbi:hypothetical protein ACN47E_000632 [Coniothyrium glycines]